MLAGWLMAQVFEDFWSHKWKEAMMLDGDISSTVYLEPNIVMH